MSPTEGKTCKNPRLIRASMILAREGYEHEEIMELLKIKDMAEFMSDRERFFDDRRRSYGVWTCKLVDDALIEWAKEWGRWPLSRDFFSVNGLPSPGVFRYHATSTHHYCRQRMKRDGSYEERLKRSRPNYQSGFGLNIWNRMACRANELTPKLILGHPNVTVRRDLMMGFGGIVPLIKEGGGKLMQQDDYGKLWRIDIAEPGFADRWSMYVEVENSTVNPDGTRDHYFLRVPPQIRSAKNAVAWTGHFSVRGVWGSVPSTFDGLSRAFDGFVAQT